MEGLVNNQLGSVNYFYNAVTGKDLRLNVAILHFSSETKFCALSLV